MERVGVCGCSVSDESDRCPKFRHCRVRDTDMYAPKLELAPSLTVEDTANSTDETNNNIR